MTDPNTVIKAWEIFRDSNPFELCSGREFRAIREPEYCMGQMIEDTIRLLKEKGIVKPFHKCIGKDYSLIEDSHYDFCPYCGERIEWE